MFDNTPGNPPQEPSIRIKNQTPQTHRLTRPVRPPPRLLQCFYVFVMNGPKMARFSTIPVPPGTVFHGGSDFDGPRA